MRVACIGHTYHLKTRSNEFFVELLRRCGEVDLFFDDSWQRAGTADWAKGFAPADYDCVVVYQSHAAFAQLGAGHPNLSSFPCSTP